MKRLAIIVTVLLFLSIGAFIYSRTGSGTMTTAAITGLTVQDVGSETKNEGQKITGNYVKEEILDEVRTTPFYKDVIIPMNGKETLISENGVYLKVQDGNVYAKHPKLYGGRWVYAGSIILGYLEAFENRIYNTKILVTKLENNGIKIKVYGVMTD